MSTDVTQLDERTMRIGERTFRSQYPIDHFFLSGDRVFIVGRSSKQWRYQGVPVDVGARRNWFFADVDAGTHIRVSPDSDRSLELPSGHRASVPGNIKFVLEIPQGFIVLVDDEDVPGRNVFLIGRDGTLKWQVGENRWAPSLNVGYNSVALSDDGRVRLEIERAGRYYADPTSGTVGT